MQTHESKNFYQVIALTFLTMCFGLCMYIAKDAKMQYFTNLRTFAKMYYIHGINQQNIVVNNINSKNNHQPIIIIKKSSRMSKTSTQQRIECSKVAAASLRRGYEEKHKVYYTKEGYQWVGNPQRTEPKFTGNQPILKNQ